MPYYIKKNSPKSFQVINISTGKIHSKDTSLKKAQAQVRLLDDLDVKKGGMEEPPPPPPSAPRVTQRRRLPPLPPPPPPEEVERMRRQAEAREEGRSRVTGGMGTIQSKPKIKTDRKSVLRLSTAAINNILEEGISKEDAKKLRRELENRDIKDTHIYAHIAPKMKTKELFNPLLDDYPSVQEARNRRVGRGMTGGVLPQNESIDNLYQHYRNIVHTWNTTRNPFATNQAFDALFPPYFDSNEPYFNEEALNGLMWEMFAFVATTDNLQGSPFFIPATFPEYFEMISEDNLEDLMMDTGDTYTDMLATGEETLTDTEDVGAGTIFSRRRRQVLAAPDEEGKVDDEDYNTTEQLVRELRGIGATLDDLYDLAQRTDDDDELDRIIRRMDIEEARETAIINTLSQLGYRNPAGEITGEIDLQGGKISARNLQGLLKQSYNPKNENFGDYEIDNSLSGQRVKVYKNKNTGEVSVVHRGTKGLSDWGNNIKYALGLDLTNNDRFNHSRDIQKKAEDKYGKENVSTLGHSMGSKIAREVGKDSKEIISLNGAYSPQDLFKPISDKEFNIRTSLDPVSALLPIKQNKNTFTIPSVSLNPLTEHKTDTLKRLPPETMIGKGKKKMSGGNLTAEQVSDIDEVFNTYRGLFRRRGITPNKENNLREQVIQHLNSNPQPITDELVKKLILRFYSEY